MVPRSFAVKSQSIAFFCLVFCVLIWTFGCGGTEEKEEVTETEASAVAEIEEPSQNGEWTTVEDTDGTFSMLIPAQWEVHADNEALSEELAGLLPPGLVPTLYAQSVYGPNVMVFYDFQYLVINPIPSRIPKEKYFQLQITDLDEKGLQLKQTRDVTIDGVQGKRFSSTETFEREGVSGSLNHSQIVLIGGADELRMWCGYVALFIQGTYLDESDRGTIDKIIESFRLLPTASGGIESCDEVLENVNALKPETSSAGASPDSGASSESEGKKKALKQFNAPPSLTIDKTKTYTAIMEMQKGGEVSIELFSAGAPITVNNFIFLAREGFYDGVMFHRVIPGFVAQAGDPTGTGSGGPGYSFANELNPNLRHDSAGILSMANRGGDATNGSQFFITYAPVPHLDGNNPDGSQKNCSAAGVSCHPVFGKVTSGMELVEAFPARDPQTATTAGEMIKTIRIVEGN